MTHSYKLTVVPPAEQGYVITVKEATGSVGLKPVRLDFDLRARCDRAPPTYRQRDGAAGGRGNARYSPLVDNPLLLEASKPDDPNRFPPRILNYSHETERDNLIQFVTYPGPGVIYAAAGWWPPLPDCPARPGGRKERPLPRIEGRSYQRVPRAILRLPPHRPEADGSATRLRHRARSRTDADRHSRRSRRPTGSRATGWGLSLGHIPRQGNATARQGKQILETAAFTATGIERDQSCTLTFVNQKRKLIGQKIVRPNDKGPLTVRLKPWGTLTGRLLDAKGNPLAEVKVRLKYPPTLDSGMSPRDQEFATDHDGRFRVEGLLPASITN